MAKVKKKKTRTQQLWDNELIDVSLYAHKHGIKYPTAVTKAVWFGYCNQPEFFGTATKDIRIQSMFRALRNAMWDKDQNDSKNLNRVQFSVILSSVSCDFKTSFIAECLPDDFGSPCITISDDWSI